MKGTIALCLALLTAASAAAAPLELKKGDHVCFLGNTLADRMQHFGGLETRIHAAFPEHELVFRNLGFSADELTIRLRSANFGSPDRWLETNKADVIFAFFGYNESFAGDVGVAKFKADLKSFIEQTLAKKYNGRTAPRLVIFSPIAHENLRDPNLPDGSANNARLKLYTAAMADVAKEQDVTFVDLFTPTLELFAKTGGKPHTINGVHLNTWGDQEVARVAVESLFAAGAKPKLNADQFAKLNAVVNDKNFYWYNRYRTTDGFSIYGGRADEPKNGLSNRPVMAREMEILDMMTANRDRRVWAAAKGMDIAADDSNLPPLIPVKTNKPGSNPDGTYPFLGGEEVIKNMTVGKGLKVSLFASEEQFPELVNPVQMAFDTKGRLWVAAWQTYPHWTPGQAMNDKLLILEDTNNDGRADKCTTFAGDIHNPTGFEFWNGGVLVARAPELLFLKDTDGDDKYDVKEIVLHGLDTADTHHTSNSFTLDPGGALYFQEGTFHHTQVETPWKTAERVANAAVFRYEPRTHKFDVYVSHGFANPHGHVFDRWGQDIVVDGTGAVPYHGALFSGHIEYPNKHPSPPTVYPQRTRPCSGLEYLTSRHFPAEFQGNLIVPNVIGFQGLLRYKVNDQGSSLGATELEPFVSSTDMNFRPTDVEIGPDGAIWLSDWQNPIIGHLQHNLRDPNRDKTHGRVYRITYEGRELNQPAKIAGEPIEKLVALLSDPEDRVRSRAKIELSSRNSGEVIAAVNRWMQSLDKSSPDYEHQMMEALWMHQYHNVVNSALLERMLASPDFRARAASVRVLCYQRDRVSNALALLKKSAADQHARVRLEAVRAASFFIEPEAIEVPLVAAELPTDTYLDYLQRETRRTLDPIWQRAVADNRTINVTTDAGSRFFLRNMTLEQLLKLERTRPVFVELLNRPGIQDAQRREALAGLAKIDKQSELTVLLGAIQSIDAAAETRDQSVVFDLVRLLTARGAADLAAGRGELEKLAIGANQPIIRQIALASLINVDATPAKAWALASKSAKSLRDYVSAVPLIADPGLRASLYPQVEVLLDKLPDNLGPAATAKGTVGRYVRIELVGNRTLTLAEVEVFSDGKNVARGGRATQKNISNGGAAARAIDGNKSPVYGNGGQTHTTENTRNPWWEVDLGEEMPIDSIAVYNRGEGFSNRLEGFSLRVLDAARNEVFRQDGNKAPQTSATIELEGTGPAALVRRAAMDALVSIRGQEAKTFDHLARFVKTDVDRTAAIRALQRIPSATWPKEQIKPLLETIVGHVKKIPSTERTSPAALDALEFADALAVLLPSAEAKAARAELAEIGVRVIRIGTLPERMAYDKEILVVKAGKPVEFLFDNSDLMPHNFIISMPGSLAELGETSERTAQSPEAIARQYVPQSSKLLLVSQLLQPRTSQKISFIAPSQPGVYPFVCTFPGHWRRMNGALYVVEDLDAYQADPEKYLAAAKIVPQDDLLKDRRPRTEWKVEDLATAVEHLEPGHSFAAGKQMFTVASCVACHKLSGVGNEFGPDLAKLDLKLQSIDILKDVLEPSHKINEKFQGFVFELTSGKIVTGLVLEETPEVVKIIENPLVKADPLVLKKSEIESRTKSAVSLMPKGLLDKLSREEILDLIAYLTARGDAKHEIFHGGHEHH